MSKKQQNDKKVEEKKPEKMECVDTSVKVIDADMLQVLYGRARKFYMRLRRPMNGTGVEKPYEDYCKQLGITRDEADKLYLAFLKKKYPDLVKLILTEKI